MTPDKFEGKIVVIIPCRNEGLEIVRTVRDFRKSKAPGTDLHFFVVDDGSTDDCCTILRPARDITVFRNEEPQGQGRARNLGALLNLDARGLISCDAHMRIDTQHGIERMVLAAEAEQAVVGAVINNLEPDHKKWNGCGGKWKWNTEPVPAEGERKAMRPGLWHTWTYRNTVHPNLPKVANLREVDLKPVTLVNGAFYAFTPATYERMGGFIESEGLCGFFEQELNLNAWFHDVPRLCATDVQVRHLFRSARPYPNDGAGYWYNYIECLRVMFDDATWRRVFEPVLLKHVSYAPTDAHIQYLLHAPSLAARHHVFALSANHTDAEALAWIGIED